MAENVTIVGDIEAASLLQSISWFGETFTVTNRVATAYNPTTGAVTADARTLTVKGMYDDREVPNIGDGGTDIRGRYKAIIIGTKDTKNRAFTFTPKIGDLITSNSIKDSIREVRELRGNQGVTVFYRLALEQA